MSKTSSEVKRRYNAKTYKEWRAQIKFELYGQIEAEREKQGMSRAQYIEHLYLISKQGNGD